MIYHYYIGNKILKYFPFSCFQYYCHGLVSKFQSLPLVKSLHKGSLATDLSHLYSCQQVSYHSTLLILLHPLNRKDLRKNTYQLIKHCLADQQYQSKSFL